MNLRMNIDLRHFLLLVSCLALCMSGGPAAAQIIFNEANAVALDPGNTDEPRFTDTGGVTRPYEGWDYGAIPYSGNVNLPTDPFPGNPFPADLSSASGVQTTFVDGFNLHTNPRGFGRIQDNGGDWIELVVTNDHSDLRGVTFFWQDDFDDDGTYGETLGSITNAQGTTFTESERGAITFSQDKAWANLRAGTVITISEQAFADEIRDSWPEGTPGTGVIDTGHDYDLSTSLAFDPFDGNDDWHIQFHLDESITLAVTPADTQFFLANSDIEVSNEQWAGKLLGPENSIINSVRDSEIPLSQLDVTTGAITDFAGEDASGVSPTWGDQTNGGGVNNQEVMALLSNPDSGEIDAAYFDDVSFSTFGLPNLFAKRTDVGDVDGDGIIEGDIVSGALRDESTLSQVQDFAGVRDPVRNNTYDWSAGGTADFANAANWQLANDNSAAASAPTSEWTARLMNQAGGSSVAQLHSSITIEFVTVMANIGTQKLDVRSEATLTVTGSTRADFESPGRVLVMGGGELQIDGVVDATMVETFDGGTISGSGIIAGHLANSGGTVLPGSAEGNVLSIGGDYQQAADATLAVVISGPSSEDVTLLDVAGVAVLDGFLDVSLNGFTPTVGSNFTIFEAASINNSGLALGNASGFSFSVTATQVIATYEGGVVGPDFNGDGDLDCADIDSLIGEIAGGSNAAAFDLTGDGIVDLSDRDSWLAAAGAANLASGGAYLLGDANLDGNVNGADFLVWNANKFSSNSAWCAGDFDADGNVNGADFLLWNGNKFSSADLVNTVPEPGLLWLYLGLAALLMGRWRQPMAL